mgnify:CR=1 FL=1
MFAKVVPNNKGRKGTSFIYLTESYREDGKVKQSENWGCSIMIRFLIFAPLLRKRNRASYTTIIPISSKGSYGPQ